MSNNNRFKVDFQSEPNGSHQRFWICDTQGLNTIQDLKIMLADILQIDPQLELEVFLQDFPVPDWAGIAIIRDDELIVVRNAVVPNVEDNRSVSSVEELTLIKEESIDEDLPSQSSSVTTTEVSLSPLPLLGQISPLIGLSNGTQRSGAQTNGYQTNGNEEPLDLTPIMANSSDSSQTGSEGRKGWQINRLADTTTVCVNGIKRSQRKGKPPKRYADEYVKY